MSKRKYYLILDTETATLPFVSELCETDPKAKQTISIAKPLVYDLGWVVMDRQGNIVKSANYLIQETFFVPNIFNTAYYVEKRALYMDMYKNGEIKAALWNDAICELLQDIQTVDLVCAYNATFDLKKAIPYTERYINNLYSANYEKWLSEQYFSCKQLLNGTNKSKNEDFLNTNCCIRNVHFEMCDLWSLACDKLINVDKYRNYCIENALLTDSAKYFKTSAETSFQYLLKQHDFIESHTALSDALIEAKILLKALKKGKVTAYLKPFPFRNLGTTVEYVENKKPKYAQNVYNALCNYMNGKEFSRNYLSQLENDLNRLEMLL